MIMALNHFYLLTYLLTSRTGYFKKLVIIMKVGEY